MEKKIQIMLICLYFNMSIKFNLTFFYFQLLKIINYLKNKIMIFNFYFYFTNIDN